MAAHDVIFPSLTTALKDLERAVESTPDPDIPTSLADAAAPVGTDQGVAQVIARILGGELLPQMRENYYGSW